MPRPSKDRPPFVALLLQRAADPALRDSRYQSTPIGWLRGVRSPRQGLTREVAALLYYIILYYIRGAQVIGSEAQLGNEYRRAAVLCAHGVGACSRCWRYGDRFTIACRIAYSASACVEEGATAMPQWHTISMN